MLKSAEVVRGTITDSIPGTSVTILAGDSLSRTISRKDIQLITTEVRRKIHTQQSNRLKENSEPPKSIYYQGILSVGYGMRKEGDNTIKANFINGIGGNENVSLGLGIGLRVALDEGLAVMPLFIDVRMRPMPTKVSPLLGFGGGYSFQIDRNFESTGQMGYLEAGISIKNRGKSFVMITIGYEKFTIKKTIKEGSRIIVGYPGALPYYSNGISIKELNIQPVSLNLGIVF